MSGEGGSRRSRYVSAAVAIPIGIGVCIFSPAAFNLLAIALITVGMVEFYAMARHRGFSPHSIIGTSCSIGICLITWVSENPAAILYSLVVTVILVFTIAMLHNVRDAIINISVTLLGVIYVGWFASHLILLRRLGGGEGSGFNPAGSGYVIMLLVLLWLADGGAFFAGIAWGKHKLIPAVSPNKTIEGAAGGIFLAVIGAAIIKELGLLLNAAGIAFFPDFSYITYFFIGLAIAITGQVGDLCESYLKRDAGLKDTGNLFPGHGGFLDRFDSLLTSAPLFYYYLRFMNQG